MTYSFVDPITIFLQFFYNYARKKWWQQLHDLGVAVAKNEEGLYTFLYKNEDIATGLSKSEVESYLKELFSKTQKSADEAKKYLDNLAETAKLRKVAFTKWASKFEKGYFNHLEGEWGITTIEKGVFKSEYIEFGQGGHKITDNVRLKGNPIPNPIPNPILNDLPFKSKIEIRYKNGKWLLKNMESSMFPKNWNIQRIQEEVAFVYENTVAKGLNQMTKRPKDLFNKFIGESTNGFEILIEVDDLGNIMNSYPYNL